MMSQTYPFDFEKRYEVRTKTENRIMAEEFGGHLIAHYVTELLRGVAPIQIHHL